MGDPKKPLAWLPFSIAEAASAEEPGDVDLSRAWSYLMDRLRGAAQVVESDPARRNRNLSSGLRIAAYALTFLADHERAERGQFDRLALLKAVRNLFQHQFNKGG